MAGICITTRSQLPSPLVSGFANIQYGVENDDRQHDIQSSDKALEKVNKLVNNRHMSFKCVCKQILKNGDDLGTLQTPTRSSKGEISS